MPNKLLAYNVLKIGYTQAAVSANFSPIIYRQNYATCLDFFPFYVLGFNVLNVKFNVT